MDLKSFLPSAKKEDPPEYFWSIIIEPGWVQAGIWRIDKETAQVIHGSTLYPWEAEEELVNSTDTALAGAIQGFPEVDEEPSKTVFGVISSWVSDGQIKEEYIKIIKKVCSDLSLSPLGFVIVPEAIAHYLKSQDGSPLNAVLVGVYKEILEISVYKLGNLLGSTQVMRSLSIVDDVKEGISRFAKGEAVPSRILLYGGKETEMEEIFDSLRSLDWEHVSDIQFLHTPKIELFSSSTKIDAVSLAGASEVSDVKSLVGQTSNDEITEESLENVSDVSPEELGFVVDDDIEKTVFNESEPVFEDESKIEEADFEETPSPKRSLNLYSFIGKHSFGDSAYKKPLLIGLSVFLVSFILLFIFWWYLPKASVAIYISPRQLDEKVDVVVDPSISVSSPGENTLAGKNTSVTVKGDRTKSTTGTRTVGDKATGTVTLYRVGSKLSLKAGTIVSSPDKLKFILDENVDVPSGSASSPSTTEVSVTAESIGAQYNLVEDTSFTVGTYTTADIEAKNAESFTGGSSREISAVSADDQKSLENELVAELKERAKEELTSTLSDDIIFIDESMTYSTASRDFSNKVGDEAKTLGLKLSIDTTAVTVSKNELLSLAQKSISEKVPEGFSLREDQIATTFNFKKKDGTKYQFEVLVSANLLPQVNPDEIAQKIRGKYPSVAEEYLLKEVPSFSRAEIVLRPPLPGKLGTLPQVTKNITIEVSAER